MTVRGASSIHHTVVCTSRTCHVLRLISMAMGALRGAIQYRSSDYRRRQKSGQNQKACREVRVACKILKTYWAWHVSGKDGGPERSLKPRLKISDAPELSHSSQVTAGHYRSSTEVRTGSDMTGSRAAGAAGKTTHVGHMHHSEPRLPAACSLQGKLHGAPHRFGWQTWWLSTLLPDCRLA